MEQVAKKSTAQKRRDRKKRISEKFLSKVVSNLSQDQTTTWTSENIPYELTKYYNQRLALFHTYSQGIAIDYDGWFSVAPEQIALHSAHRFLKAFGHGATVIDVFTGVGGNAIQFALAGLKVVAIDLDPVR